MNGDQSCARVQGEHKRIVTKFFTHALANGMSTPSLIREEPMMTFFAPQSNTSRQTSAERIPPPTWQGSFLQNSAINCRLTPYPIAASKSIS